MQPRLQTEALSKRFGGTAALQDVSLCAHAGEVLGVVGENGAGKSTLMNLLAGVLTADAGRMLLDGASYAPASPADAARCGVAFVHQELNLFPNLNIAENLFLTTWTSRKRIFSVTRERLTDLGLALPPDTLVENLSPGERQLVEIAKAFHRQPRVVIFDEPTTSLSDPEAERLYSIVRRLTAGGAAVIYVSHALSTVLRVAHQILVLRDGHAVAGGAAKDFTEEGLITLMVGRPIAALYPKRAGGPCAELVFEARELSHPGVLENVSFTLRRGEILGVAGLMGSGRSELARILFGLDSCLRGQVLLEKCSIDRYTPRQRVRAGVAYLTESRRHDGLLMTASAADNLALVSPHTARPDKIAGILQLRCASLDRQPVDELSGGNQQKVALGKWLAASPKVMILDEPTRGIDVGARLEIYRVIHHLADSGTALLLISSEIEELIGICDRILVMRHGALAGEFQREAYSRERILACAL